MDSSVDRRRQRWPALLVVFTVIASAMIGGLAGGALVFQALGVPTEVPPSTPVAVQINPPVSLFPASVSLDINTTVTEVVALVAPAVVTVVNHLEPRATFFGGLVQQTSSGSGAIISQDGTVVTNNHVVDGAEWIEVILANGTELPAELLGVDLYADLAVLHVEGEMPGVMEWGNSDTLKPGETVIAIGSALGSFMNTVTVGVVSATERSIETESGFLMEGLIQTDAAINSGNSGGPLINLAGQLIGINTLVVRGSSRSGFVAEGLGFAIPSNPAIAIVNQLTEAGHVSRPNLGVRWQWITPGIASRNDLPVDYGVYLTEIIADGPADQAGLLEGDIIISIDGQELDEDHPFINQLFKYQPGEIVTLVAVRRLERLEVTVTLVGMEEL